MTTKSAKKAAEPKKQKLNEAWSEVLIENERAKRSDAELVEEMERRFPDRKGKSTITRVTMIRSCYNKGTNLFEKFGPAGTSSRPMSHQYDDDGAAVPGRKKAGEAVEKAVKKAAKNAVKKSTKKVAKKSVKKSAKKAKRAAAAK